MQQHYEEIRQLGGEVLAISFAPPERVAAYVARYPLPFPVLADPQREGYRAFALGRTSWLRMLNPLVILRYFALMVRGWKPWKPDQGDDLLQLGGDFVLDRQRRLVFAHPSNEPTDRPSMQEVLAAVRTAAAAPARNL